MCGNHFSVKLVKIALKNASSFIVEGKLQMQAKCYVKCDSNVAMQVEKCVPRSRSKIHKFQITCNMEVSRVRPAKFN